MGRLMQAGAIDQSIVLKFIDASTGQDETGMAWNTPGLALWYWRPGLVKTAIVPVSLATLDAVHTDGGFLHIAEGECRLDLPDAAINTVGPLWIGGNATGMTAVREMIDCVAFNPGDAAALGLTALGSSFLEARAVAALHTALVESYAAVGVPGSVAQTLFMIQGHLTQLTRSGTTITIFKLDGVTPAATLTLDAVPLPTAITRTT